MCSDVLDYFNYFTLSDATAVYSKMSLSLFSTWRICSRKQTKYRTALHVRGEYFCQPISTNHVAGFLFLLCVAQTKSPSAN